MLAHPQFDPVALSLGPLQVHWYGLTYLVAFGLFLFLAGRRVRQPSFAGAGWTRRDVEDLLFFGVVGVILGGRLGYVLFYKPGFYIEHPLAALTLWEGGMSFHGGLLGVIAAILLFAMRNKADPFMLSDLVAIVAPLGLLFGRLANFINGELWGRVSDVPWAMVFPRGGPLPRHPSQLYQAFFEGVLLTLIVVAVWKLTEGRRRPGLLTGVFCAGYGLARIVGELFREPDAHLGYLWGPVTMGMLLSLPVLLFGLWLILRAYRKPALP